MPRTTPTQKRRKHHAPEAAEPADHDDDEGDGDDLRPHRRMNDRDGRKQRATKRRHAHPENDDGRHVGLQTDAQCSDHVRSLDAGANHASE